MAGLAAAHWLRRERPDIEVLIFEKSRGVGGRTATRRVQGAVFDHGAQYIKVATPEIEQLLSEVLAHETLVDIGHPVWTFDSANHIHEGDSAQNAEPKWSYSDGITRLAKELARNVTIQFGTRIQRFEHTDAGYKLYDQHDAVVSEADALLITAPGPQAHALVEQSRLPQASQQALLDELAKATYRRCLTLTLGYPPLLAERPFYALVNTDKKHPISWLAYEHLKPGRPNTPHVLIAQMAPQWSVAHWEDALPDLTQQIQRLVSELLAENLPEPLWSDRQGWRYALPDHGANSNALNSALPGCYFAGDYTAGQGRVHLAIEQGWQVAERIVGTAVALKN
jgi:predicted NAD/FAD-dependent oxidoreductase